MVDGSEKRLLILKICLKSHNYSLCGSLMLVIVVAFIIFRLYVLYVGLAYLFLWVNYFMNRLYILHSHDTLELTFVSYELFKRSCCTLFYFCCDPNTKDYAVTVGVILWKCFKCFAVGYISSGFRFSGWSMVGLLGSPQTGSDRRWIN